MGKISCNNKNLKWNEENAVVNNAETIFKGQLNIIQKC